MSSNPMIDARDLGKMYFIYKRPIDRLKQMISMGRWRTASEYWALDSVNLTVGRGETLGIIGRNGSGKSTLLQLLYGTLTPTKGALSVRGRMAALIELGAGFNPEFSGRENVYLSASVLGLTREKIDERFQAIEQFAAIGDFIDQPVKIYSSGMYARLAFAVAAHVDADILVIDEILSVGDAAFNQKCMRYIRGFRERGTILFVSHDLGAIVNLCDRCLWLERGAVRSLGPAKQVAEEYMAALAGEQDTGDRFRIGGERKGGPPVVKQDHRHEELKNSNVKNVLAVFDFNREAPWFGDAGGKVEMVRLLGSGGAELKNLTGGETVTLEITAVADRELTEPILGFFLKDRLGQHLFGDNTYLTYRDKSITLPAGARCKACFEFVMPYLPTGDYSVTVAIASGTQASHSTHQWVEDALFFSVLSSHVTQGLVGIPMNAIRLEPVA